MQQGAAAPADRGGAEGGLSFFWQTVHAGVVSAGRDLNVEVLWNAPTAETDFSRQIQIVDSMLAQRVDGLAIAASDRTALNASLDRAAQLGIPVAVFDSGVDSTNYMTFVATNNFAAGRWPRASWPS